MDKVLLVASVPSMIGQFNIPNIKLLLEMGYEVNVACNFYDRSVWDEVRVEKFKEQLKELNVKFFHVSFSRNILKLHLHKNAYIKLLKVVKENNYQFIHCHTPIGGVIARLVTRKTNTKVIYTAHGFHFYKGAPLKNWLLFYPIEKFLAKYTDVIITINKEDYNRAKKFKAKKVSYLPGVGIDTYKYKLSENIRAEKRLELKLNEDDFVLLSVGELNKNKNHEVVIRAISKLRMTNVKYIICGIGLLKEDLIKLADSLGVGAQVIFLDYRRDILEISQAADAFVFPSYREGLSVALMEAMASGLPILCSKIRGNTDLVIENQGGILVKPSDIDAFANCIKELLLNENARKEYGKFNQIKIKDFDIKNVNEIMKNVYSHFV